MIAVSGVRLDLQEGVQLFGSDVLHTQQFQLLGQLRLFVGNGLFQPLKLLKVFLLKATDVQRLGHLAVSCDHVAVVLRDLLDQLHVCRRDLPQIEALRDGAVRVDHHVSGRYVGYEILVAAIAHAGHSGVIETDQPELLLQCAGIGCDRTGEIADLLDHLRRDFIHAHQLQGLPDRIVRGLCIRGQLDQPGHVIIGDVISPGQLQRLLQLGGLVLHLAFQLVNELEVFLGDIADIQLCLKLHRRFRVGDFLGQALVFLSQVNDGLLFLRLLVQRIELRVQIFEGWIRRVNRSGDSADPGHKKADASGNSQDDSHAGDGSPEQQVRRCRQLRDCGICGDRRGGQAEHAHEGGQSLDDSRVLLNEFRNGLQDARKAVRNAGNHWSQRIANGDLHIVGCVGKHLQTAFGGGIPFLCFSGEGGIFPEGVIRVPDGVGHQIAGSRQRQNHALHPGLGDPQIVQNDGCGGAVALHIIKAGDEGGQRVRRVIAPCFRKLGCAHAGYAGEVSQTIPGFHGHVQLADQLRHAGGACRSFNTQGGNGCGQAHHVGLAHACQGSGSGNALAHVDDLLLCGGVVVAQIDHRGCQVAVLARIHLSDVCKLGQHGSRFVCRHGGGGGQHAHGGGEVQQVVLADAQLTGNFHHVGQLRGSDRDLRRELHHRLGHGLQLGCRHIRCFGYAGHGTFKLDGCVRAFLQRFIGCFQPLNHACGLQGCGDAAKQVSGASGCVQRIQLGFHVVDLL